MDMLATFAAGTPVPPAAPHHSQEDAPEAEAAWPQVKKLLHAELGDDIYTSWFARMELERLEAGTARMSVPTRFLKSWITTHYGERVLACWQAQDPSVCRVELVVRSAVLCTHYRKPPVAESPTAKDVRTLAYSASEAHEGGAHEALGGSPLDPRFTLDTFVAGRSNTLAYAACKQVALAQRGDALMFNPLFIHGSTGLGKTHLLQATTRAVNAAGVHTALYLTAEKFMYGFVSAVRTSSALAYKEALREVGVLVIDDLQFLQGKSTQAEFCHMLNALIDAGRQVVVGCDRPPSDLEQLDERARSRLAGGLTVEVGNLGEELRLEILHARVAALKEHHPSFEVPSPVLAYVARTVTHNGRDLEGALNRLFAHHKLTGQPVTIELAEREVRDLVRPQEPKRVKIEDIQRAVARQYNVSRADLLSSRRTANVVRPRHVAMYLAKTLTLRSLPEIGRRFGGRDHTTVLHACRRIEGLVGNDPSLADEIERVKQGLES